MSEEEKGIVLSKPALTRAEFANTHKDLAIFVKNQLREADIKGGKPGDYGIIPYTNKKSLLKPGAEKLLKLFGLSAQNELIKAVEDWDKKFVYYRYKCTITHIQTGAFIASATRSCNNRERKHANKDVYDVANTIEAVAQKRALVAATVQATMASEIFDADLSGEEENDTAPGKPANKEDDPERVRILARFFATVQERGFPPETAKRNMYKKFNVTTMSDISNKDITETTEKLISEWDVVGKGEKPKKIGHMPVGEPVEEGEVVTDDEYYSKSEAEVAIEAEKELLESKKKEEDTKLTGEKNNSSTTTSTQRLRCYNCDEPLEGKKISHEYFCSDDCHQVWYDSNYGKSKKKDLKSKLESFGKGGEAK